MKTVVLSSILLLTGCSSISFDSINGKNKDEILNELGKPISVMQESNHEMWTYKDKECAKYIFFDENGVAVMVKKKGSCFW